MTVAPPRFDRLRGQLLRILTSASASGLARSSGSVAAGPPGLPPADWHKVLAALPDPALLLDRQSEVLAYNDRAAELFPHLSPDLPISAVSRNPDLLEGIGLVRDGANEITVMLAERVPLERTLRATLANISDDRGGPEMLVTFRDLSEVTQIEKTRTDFVANASHELRTPLASIIGFIETLQGAEFGHGCFLWF